MYIHIYIYIPLESSFSRVSCDGQKAAGPLKGETVAIADAERAIE